MAELADQTTDASEPLVDDPNTAFDETQCAEGNHGKTVSSVAKSVEPGPEHGAAVAEAAHSTCGKSTTTEPSDERTSTSSSTSTTDDLEADDEGEVHTSDPAPSAKHGQGRGRGHDATGDGEG